MFLGWGGLRRGKLARTGKPWVMGGVKRNVETGDGRVAGRGPCACPASFDGLVGATIKSHRFYDRIVSNLLDTYMLIPSRQTGDDMSQIDQLKSDIDELVPGMVALRRDLHEHPELAFEEVRTSGIVAQRLRSLGLEVQTGVAKTGVVGLLRGEAPKAGAKTIAIRADMDALPIHEMNEIDYRSTVDGKMHACGHDGHTSILLTVADILSKRRAELSGDVKFIFQPAEEVIGGAEPMVKEGAMEGVDSVIGLHLISDYTFGRVGVRAGTVFASADKFVLTVKGKGGHAAMPHGSVDPIVISAYIITALQTLISRETSPFWPAVITIGTIQAGTAFNIIPETVQMQGTMRAFTT